MKKVLVTGGLGFIGSNWVRMNSDRYNIVIVDNFSAGSNKSNLSDVKLSDVIRISICDISHRSLPNGFIPDAIIHFAAESHVDRSIEDPLGFIKTNVMGTANMLEMARHYNCRFVHVSTDEVFGHLGANDPPFNENTPYDPRSPYSASKASSDHIVRAYHETYGLDVVITNTCNNYGPHQDIEKLVPKVITNALCGKKIPIYGQGLNIREWIFVDDNCRALTLALEKGVSGETYCIGTGDEKTNIDLVLDICHTLDDMFPLKDTLYEDQIVFVEDRAGHDARYAINNYKIQSDLGWEPIVPFEKGLEKTIGYYYGKLV